MMPVITPWLGPEEAEAAGAAIRSGWIAQGPRVAEFEQAFARRVGGGHGVAVSSCTAALHMGLHALGISGGYEVVVPSLSFIATANAPRYVGATPVFADVDRITQNLTAATIEPVLSRATKAVILVHQVGMPADIDAITELCGPRGITVFEDAACAAGSAYRGHPIGGHSDLVAFSFHPRKLLTTGEGGMLVTPNRKLAERLRGLRQHGMSVSADVRHSSDRVIFEEYRELGFNYRMTDIQAAIGLVQLTKLDDIVRRRRDLAAGYQELLALVPGVECPQDPEYGTTNFQSYSIVLTDDYPLGRDELLQRLLNHGISPRRGVMAAHQEPAFEGHPHVALPITEFLADRSVILPMSHGTTVSDLERVVEVIAEAAS